VAAATSRAPLGGLANLMAMKGREGDSMLVHLSPREVSHLNRLSGNTMTINPQTGLLEGKSRFLRAVLPAIAAITGSILMPHMIPTILGSTTLPMMLGAGVGTYGGARLAGFKHSEALPKAGISALTAGLFGGLGTGADEIAGQAGEKIIAGKLAEQKAAEAVGSAFGPQQVLGGPNLLEKMMEANLQKEAIGKIGTGFTGFQPLSTTIGKSIAYRGANPESSILQSITETGGWPSLGVRAAGETGFNLLGDQMISDASKTRDLSRPPSATGELWSQPYNMALQGPFSQEDIAGAYIGDNITPINFYNQGYAKEGGSVQHMAHGGLAGLPVHMGIGGGIGKILTAPLRGLHSLIERITGRRRGARATPDPGYMGVRQPLQLGNPFGGDPMSPPLPANIFEQAQEEDVQLAGGGKILNKLVNDWGLLGLGTKALTGDSITDNIRNIMDTPDLSKPPVIPQYFDQEVDTETVQLAFGGKLGKMLGIGGGSGSYSPSSQGGPRGSSQGGKGAGFFNEMFNNPEVLALLKKHGQDVGGSQGMDQFAGLTDNPTQQMAGGGILDKIPPELLEMIKAQASAQVTPRAYDQLAALGPNPMQQMQGGGLTGAADAAGAMMPALQPLLQVASEEGLEGMAQPRTYAQTQPVQPFQAGGQAFEGRVAGRGDGMSDQIPFNIEGQQPALLSRDEYVVPADVVAMIGDGSSNAGADQFDNFIGDIRQMKYGRQVQPREINQGLGSLLGVA